MWITQLLVHLLEGTLSLEIKRSECKVDHSPPSSTGIKNKFILPILYVLILWTETFCTQYIWAYIHKHKQIDNSVA